jgi:KRAB domain-containing zinc finger protein
VCKKRFVSKFILKQHVQRVHGEGHQFKCDVCTKSFTILYDLKKHKLLHSEDGPYRCDTCNMSFSLLRTLKAHVFEHTNEYAYPCDLCGKGFIYQTALEKHKRVHTGERPYVCKVCDNSFTQKGALNYHKRIHTGERPYTCRVCSKSFTTKGTLKRHEVVHSEERPFTCVCNKSFKLKKHLTSHILLNCPEQIIDTEEPRFKCRLCKKSFSSKNHYQNIVGNLLNMCDVCSVAEGTSNVQKSSTQL